MSAPDIKVPKAPEPEKTLEERKARISGAAGRQRRLAAGGIQSTILTGPGASSSSGGKTLLGQ